MSDEPENSYIESCREENGNDKQAESIVKDNEKWDNFSNWIHCICVVTFDLELGQAIESVYPPHVILSKQESTSICYLAFPDSNSGCMGNTYFVVRLRRNSTHNNLSKHHASYNKTCPASLQIQPDYFWGYVYFRQVKDVKLPRGYFQKSLVILSRLPFSNLFYKLSFLIAPEYFANGPLSLEAACSNIGSWSPPVPGEILNLPILGTIFRVYIPAQCTLLSTGKQNTVDTTVYNKESSLLLPSVADISLFEIILPVLTHIYLLWELVLIAEPIVVMAPSPTNCSSLVVALTSLISPLKYCADHRPYFTIHDNEFKEFTSNVHGTPNVILGVTNPYFSKTLHNWPHTIKLSENIGSLIKYKFKKKTDIKILDSSPGLYSGYRPYLQKDKTVIKKLLLGVHSKRPPEVQTALLRRHLLELTQSFMIPLERYIASLMPLQKNISPFKAAPTPLPFNPDDFLSTLQISGPQLTSGVKGDWVGLYRRFFRSPNFNGWFNIRYRELALKLQALQLQALSSANMKRWVQDKPEVELVDMVLKIKTKLKTCKEHDVSVTRDVKHRLTQRLEEVLCSLPEDLKKILEVI